MRLTQALLAWCLLFFSLACNAAEQGTVPGSVPIHYQTIGAGPPVIFLHGAGGPFLEREMTAFAARVMPEFTLVNVDIRGYGSSGKPDSPEDYGLALVEDINRLLAHLELDGAHIIGYSMGGKIGLKYAALYPEKVRSLSVIGEGLATIEYFQDMEKIGREIVTSSNQTPFQKENLHLFTALRPAQRALLVSEEEAQALSVPILAVVGEDDSSVALARRLKDEYPQTHMVIVVGYDHSTIWDHDSPMHPLLGGFLREMEKDAGP